MTTKNTQMLVEEAVDVVAQELNTLWIDQTNNKTRIEELENKFQTLSKTIETLEQQGKAMTYDDLKSGKYDMTIPQLASKMYTLRNIYKTMADHINIYRIKTNTITT